jgi:oxygen-independent coproporphyrinogen-3 oxidase
MEPQTVHHVIDTISKQWQITDNCEITLEANPTSIEAEKFRLFHQAGINRVSVGVQSLRDDQLSFLGREHNSKEALNALEIAHKTFDRMSFDLIYARPNQTMQEWQDELTQALQFQKGHLSLYQLTIEDGTQFKTLRDSGRLIELDYDCAGDMYLMTTEMMDKAGLPAYEISNYAALNQQSRHNMTYWRYQDYVGIGPGAHGRLTLTDGRKVATRTHKAPDMWMKQVFERGDGAKPYEYLSVQECQEEKIMMGLRLREGIEFDDSHINQDKNFDTMFQNGFLVIEENRLKVPVDKWPVLDSILAKLLLQVKG